MNPYHLQRKICFQQGLYITGWLVQSIYRTLFPTTSKHLCSSYTNILIVSWPRHVLSLVAQCAPLLLQHLLYEALSGAPNKFASRILCRTRTTLISDFALNCMALPLNCQILKSRKYLSYLCYLNTQNRKMGKI